MTPANLFSLVTVPWIRLSVWYLRMDRGSSRKSETEELVVALLPRSRGRLEAGWLSSASLEVLRLGEDWTRRWWSTRGQGGASRSRPVSNDLLILLSISCRLPTMLQPPPLLTLVTPLMVTGEVTVVRAWEIANPDLHRDMSQWDQFIRTICLCTLLCSLFSWESWQQWWRRGWWWWERGGWSRWRGGRPPARALSSCWCSRCQDPRHQTVLAERGDSWLPRLQHTWAGESWDLSYLVCRRMETRQLCIYQWQCWPGWRWRCLPGRSQRKASRSRGRCRWWDCNKVINVDESLLWCLPFIPGHSDGSDWHRDSSHQSISSCQRHHVNIVSGVEPGDAVVGDHDQQVDDETEDDEEDDRNQTSLRQEVSCFINWCSWVKQSRVVSVHDGEWWEW